VRYCYEKGEAGFRGSIYIGDDMGDVGGGVGE
jgi:hypothetical protein